MSDPSDPKPSIVEELGVKIGDAMFYPLNVAPAINPCAGKPDKTPCGFGCECRGGQCYYSTAKLRQMGITVPDI